MMRNPYKEGKKRSMESSYIERERSFMISTRSEKRSRIRLIG